MQELDVFNCPLDGIHLIEASAGTGKTWNICGLYLRLLLEQERRVEEILVVTFTKSATAELRERIRDRLAELLRALQTGVSQTGGDPFIRQLISVVINSGRVTPFDAKQRIELALHSFDAAAIFTIHGFCQRALAETPFAASQPFQFEFAADDTTLHHEVATDFWRQHITRASLDDGFAAHIIEHGFGPEWLAEQLGRRLKKPLAHLLWPDFPPTAKHSPQALERAFKEARARWADESDSINDIVCGSLTQLNGNSYKAASVQAATAGWSHYFSSGNPLGEIDDKQKLFRASYLSQKTKKNCVTPEHPFFRLAETLLDLRQCGIATFELQRLKLLHDWLAHGPQELLRRKQERRLVSYDDLLAKLHRALYSAALPWLAAELHKRYPCALIDEFQDTDPLQFQIFDKIYAANTRGPLFLVGDPKQAIYSFRSADLNTYLSARDLADAQHTLCANQRSTAGLIGSLNQLFSANPSAFILRGLHYQRVEVGGKPRKEFQDLSATQNADLQVWMLPDENEGLLLKKEAKQQVADATAAEISRLLRQSGDGQILIDHMALKPADIAVIVRSHAQGSAMKQALGTLGIGCVELSQASIFHSSQAEEVERLIRAVNDPTSIAALKAALSGEMLGKDAIGIEAINSNEGELSTWVQKFQDYREVWLEHGFGFMWRTLLRKESCAVRLLSLPDGERKFTNLLHVGELLQEAAAIQPGIEGLLRWLAQNRNRQGSTDDTAQLRLESDENLVQILTIHKSKGLEFPIVFCPFLFDGGSGGGRKGLEGLEYHQNDQGVIDFSLDDDHIAIAKEMAKLEDSAENARLLYVALTRAVYRCYLVAGCYGIISKGKPSMKESARSILNWLVAGNGATFSEWQKGDTAPAAIAAAWSKLSSACDGALTLSPLPTTTPGIILPPDQSPTDTFTARTPQVTLFESWRLGSFSSLNRFREQESAAHDHDAVAAAPAALRGEVPSTICPDDFLRFPSGAAAGECLHRVLELCDFSNTTTWEGAIRRGLRERPPAAHELPDIKLATMLRSLLTDLLTTPLHNGLQLSNLPQGQCLPELEFCFPTNRLNASDLNRCLAQHGYQHPRFSFPALQGFMKGFIDLVFFYQGRYYLLDWKSNHLGYNSCNYNSASLADAMHQHGYHLQALIYSVALHRYLATRLADYDYTQHFGGCLYLFVRGIRPTWHNDDGSQSGVYYHFPALACVEELNRLFTPCRES